MVCAKHTIGSEISFYALIVLLRDVGQVEPPFGPIGDSVNLDARYVHSLYRTCNSLENNFG
jgi:hypothetical protein